LPEVPSGQPVLDLGTADGAVIRSMRSTSADQHESLAGLAERCGWRVLASTRTGASDSDPATDGGDERQFLLLESFRFDEAL